jgi:hypothetical protein
MPVYGGRRTRAGAPSSETDPGRGRGGPSREAEPARGGAGPRAGRREAHPFERDGASSREARTLERGEACLRGSSRGSPWWAVEVLAAWAVSCMVRQSVFGFVADFKWGFPGC